MTREEELVFTALCDRFRSPTQVWQSMSLTELEEATGLDKVSVEEALRALRGPMVTTTRASHMGQDGSFSVQPGASGAEISRTIRDPADRDTSRPTLRTLALGFNGPAVAESVSPTPA